MHWDSAFQRQWQSSDKAPVAAALAREYVGKRACRFFQFKDRTDMLLVLAHELGHALGLGHNRNPQSIMAPLIVTKELALSPDDLAALKAVSASGDCEARPGSPSK